ncbi:discoidin domain-containing protein [Verrucomicrobiota bacterium]
MKKNQNIIVFICLLCFGLLYLHMGMQIAKTQICDYDGLVFHADTAEVAEDITRFHTPNHGDTNVHPLFVLLINPFGVLLAKIFPVPQAVLILNTIIGILIVWTAYLFFANAGLSFFQTLLWSVLTGASACNMFFAIIPERHITASLAITFMCLSAIKYSGRIKKFLPAGILSLGITITNFFQCLILFAASLLNKLPSSNGKIIKIIKKTTAFSAATLVTTTALSLIQSWIWPHTRFFFIPSVYKEETSFLFTPDNLKALFTRFLELLSHIFYFNIAAPSPLLRHDTLMFDLRSFACYSFVGCLTITLWSILAALSIYLFSRGHRRWSKIQAGLLLCILFNVFLHMFYGDDFFIYTTNWTFIVIAATALTFSSGISRPMNRLTNILLSGLVCLTIFNNYMFISDVSLYLHGRNAKKWKQWDPPGWKTAKEIESFLQAEEISAVYGNSSDKWLFYAMDSTIPFVNVADEKSAFLRAQGEFNSNKYAFINNEGNVSSFIEHSGGSFSIKNIGPYSFVYNIIPPREEISLVPSNLTKSIQCSSNPENALSITDVNMDTVWQPSGGKTNEEWIEIVFKEKIKISGIRIFSKNNGFPSAWRIETQDIESGKWTPAESDMNTTRFFWSGPRLYWHGNSFFLECRFPANKTKKLRITFPEREQRQSISIAEVLILRPAGNVEDFPRTLSLLSDLLETRNIKHFYGERWVANEIFKRFCGEITVPLEPYIFKNSFTSTHQRPETIATPVFFTPKTAILVKKEFAAQTRYCLENNNIKMRETSVGPWILFDFTPDQWSDSLDGYSKMYWAGTACFLANPNWATKQKAFHLTQKALSPDINSSERTALLEQALSFYPDSQETLLELEKSLRKTGGNRKADSIRKHLNSLIKPETEFSVQFERKTQLLGVSINKTNLNSDRQFNIKYYWKCKPSLEHKRWVVFVHFYKDGKRIKNFQGDHILLNSYSEKELNFQPYDEIFSEEHKYTAPENIQPGIYEIVLGIYDRATNSRLTPETYLPQRKKQITLPLKIEFE